MELTPSQKKTVRHQFDSYCRKVLCGEAYDYNRHLTWRSRHETTLSGLPAKQIGELSVLDEYSCEQFRFQVQGYSILIRSETLANAIARLSNENRSIVLLSYFLDMTDQEIADKLDMVRRTVNYKHMRSLEKLREEMEVDSGGEQNK